MTRFEIKAKDGLARLGRFTTEHGTVTTPLLMPVVHPSKSAIMPRELDDHFGFQMVITNSYIISRDERFREPALADGVHGLLDFDGPIMTDSGTFQMYFHGLPSEEIDPLEIVRFQRDIGTDIGTILDAFSAPDVGRTRVEEDVKVSLEHARLSLSEKGDMMLAGTVQGGIYVDLREYSARELAKLGFDVHPVGGVVPLMEQYRYSDVVRVTLAAKRFLPPNRPVHLFGCGHPMFLALAAALGCDFFDSASYAKFAEDDRLMLTTGTVHLEDLRELPCECPVCSSITVDDLRQMKKRERETALMRHNLYVTAAEMRRVRQAILEGRIIELAAIRARAHPSLYQALMVLLEHREQLERSHPVGTTSSIFYTGPETVRLIPFYRFHSRIMCSFPYHKTRTLLIVPHLADTPFADTTPRVTAEVRRRTPEELLVVYLTPFGVVPWELEHVHPSQQSVFPRRVDSDTLAIVEQRAVEFLSSINAEQVMWFGRDTPTDTLYSSVGSILSASRFENSAEIVEQIPEPAHDSHGWKVRKLRAIFAYQWELPSVDLTGVRIELSRSTGKIRHLKSDDTVLFTVVPTTGLLTPTVHGGEMLMQMRVSSRFVVKMHDEAVPFVREGRSALAKFVVDASPELRAGEEVVVQDTNGELLAVGKALLSGPEMLAFDRGVAVSIRHSSKQ
ncbi:MAG: tRNA guanosine(15) transglycosylase TgtA, partial [Candidatus Thorarchaeota archaeon]